MISSCSRNFYKREELKVFNSVFIDLIGTDYYYENPLTHPLELEYCKSHEDSLFYYKRNDEIEDQLKNPKLDTSRLVIAFNESLIYPPKEEIKGIKKRLKSLDSYIPDTIDIKDYIPLLETLTKRKYISQTTIDLSDLNKTGRYELEGLKQFRIDNPKYNKIKGFRFIGDMKFSRVYFNKTYDKGIFYRYFMCGGDCGTADIIFVEKKDDKWLIKWTLNLWVS